MTLQDEIEKQSSQIRTDSYPMSIGELLNLYDDNEIDVHPEFQRIFRWSNSQKTRLIESILLGIPIPPIFVAQRKNGVWDVVDGQQRLSTILEFVGKLKNENDELAPPLVLSKTKFLPSLEGKTWNGEKSFTRDQQLYIKRAKIDVNIVLKESDVESKYELFMRLNTGGTPLVPQEVRNCLMIMAYPKTYDWIKELSENSYFENATGLSDRAKDEAYSMELATRFVLFRKMPKKDLSSIGDIGDFLDDQIKVIDAKTKLEKKTEAAALTETFHYICSELDDNAFRKYDSTVGKFKGGFSISSFEAIALGVGYNISKSGKYSLVDNFEERVQKLWSDPDFTSNSGSGVRASTRIPKIVPLGRKLFKP